MSFLTRIVAPAKWRCRKVAPQKQSNGLDRLTFQNPTWDLGDGFLSTSKPLLQSVLWVRFGGHGWYDMVWHSALTSYRVKKQWRRDHRFWFTFPFTNRVFWVPFFDPYLPWHYCTLKCRENGKQSQRKPIIIHSWDHCLYKKKQKPMGWSVQSMNQYTNKISENKIKLP